MHRIALALALLLPTLAACRRSPQEEIEQARTVGGTPFVIRVWAVPSERVFEAIGRAYDRMAEIHKILSETEPESDARKLEEAAGRDPIEVREETLAVLQLAREVSERSGGAFDLTWARYRDLWGTFNADPGNVDDKKFRDKLVLARAKVGYDRIEVDPVTRKVRLAEREMKIGFGAVAKGYAIEQAAHVLHDAGYRDFIVDGGGDLYVSGQRGNRYWLVGLRHPRAGPERTFAALPVHDRAVATTGDYGRWVESRGRRFHHLLDARTGFPADGCVEVTVLHPSAALADALATAAFILGPDHGMALLQTYPGTEAVIVDANLAVHLTPGLRNFAPLRWLKAEAEEP